MRGLTRREGPESGPPMADGQGCLTGTRGQGGGQGGACGICLSLRCPGQEPGLGVAISGLREEGPLTPPPGGEAVGEQSGSVCGEPGSHLRRLLWPGVKAPRPGLPAPPGNRDTEGCSRGSRTTTLGKTSARRPCVVRTLQTERQAQGGRSRPRVPGNRRHARPPGSPSRREAEGVTGERGPEPVCGSPGERVRDGCLNHVGRRGRGTGAGPVARALAPGRLEQGGGGNGSPGVRAPGGGRRSRLVGLLSKGGALLGEPGTASSTG